MSLCFGRSLAIAMLGTNVSAVLVTVVRAAPTTVPATVPATSTTRGEFALSAVTLDRGNAVRTLLRDTLERAYAADGAWPDAVDAPRDLAYRRPTFPATAPARPLANPRVTAIVFEESLDAHPDGVWIGYADGHVEFAATRDALDACRAGREVAAAAQAYDEADVGPPPADATLTLRVLDPDGRPAAGAAVGGWAVYGDRFPRASHVSLVDQASPAVADADGLVTLTAAQAFGAKFARWRAAPLWIVDERRDLIAHVTIDRADLGRPGGDRHAPRDVRLQPACHVRGVATSLGLRERGRGSAGVIVIPFVPGQMRQYTCNDIERGDAFDVPLPPGDWGIESYADTESAVRYVRIAPGQRELRLNVDLPITVADALVGRPAPELTAVKAWKNAPPLTLAALRGKVVLLDFWGHWCNPCCEAMPELMKLYDEFHAQGLEVIAVHDDSVASLDALEAKLVPIRARQWAGRDLPFPVALDGGGETRVRYTARVVNGATCAAYGIGSWPTTIAIGRDGNVIGDFDVGGDGARDKMIKLLAAEP